MRESKLMLVPFILTLGLFAKAGVISGGGAGFPALAPDIKFTYQCLLSLVENVGDKANGATSSFIYDETAGANSGVIQIHTKKDDWEMDQTSKFSIPLDGHRVVIGAGMVNLALALNESTKIENSTRAQEVNTVFQSKTIIGSLTMKKTVDGVDHIIQFSVGCIQK